VTAGKNEHKVNQYSLVGVGSKAGIPRRGSISVFLPQLRGTLGGKNQSLRRSKKKLEDQYGNLLGSKVNRLQEDVIKPASTTKGGVRAVKHFNQVAGQNSPAEKNGQSKKPTVKKDR